VGTEGQCCKCRPVSLTQWAVVQRLSRGAFSAETLGQTVSTTRWPVGKHFGEFLQGLI
jgi:hypothetical protein